MFLDGKFIFIKKIKNADKIYTYLMKLKLNKCIGANSNCRNFIAKNTFTLSIKRNLV